LNPVTHSNLPLKASEPVASLNVAPESIRAIEIALSEDVGSGDATTDRIVPPGANACARIIAKQDGVVSGVEIAKAVFLYLDSHMKFDAAVSDGTGVLRGQILIELSGSGRAILTGERTALNFVGRMSGIATLTRQFVDAVSGTNVVILDTRKTVPGLRSIDKLAVRHGGAQNHRHGLYDMVLIKNNHIDVAGSLNEAVRRVRESGTDLEIEVEARTISELQHALEIGINRILLDNMTIDTLHQAVRLSGGRAKLEASGNVTLANVREIAETGVDFISVGALTHSAKAFDVSLRLVNTQ
jgi:nicotinate-nucleotide pyrophosphorylase (carboxylating)